MPITQHTHEYSTQADGSTSSVVRMYDQDGREYMQTFFAPAGFNIDAKIINMIAELDEQLKVDEFNALVGS